VGSGDPNAFGQEIVISGKIQARNQRTSEEWHFDVQCIARVGAADFGAKAV
jgi:hypothetical protein